MDWSTYISNMKNFINVRNPVPIRRQAEALAIARRVGWKANQEEKAGGGDESSRHGRPSEGKNLTRGRKTNPKYFGPNWVA